MGWMKLISSRLPALLYLLTLLVLVGGCSQSKLERTESFALTDTDQTRLGKTFIPKAQPHPENSGLRPMLSGIDAFAARVTLADLSEKSLDLQYYIWDPDDTGRLLAERLLAAANRGVRVRALLDDFGAIAEDQRLLALDSHPNIEVRLINPIALRGNDIVGMLLDFSRTTRRMHNKSFIADNQVAIIGGRNIGDAYFQAGAGLDMADVDVMAIGPVVPEVSKQFDLYWNSPSAVPIGSVADRPLAPDALAAGINRLETHAKKIAATQYGQWLTQSPIAEEIKSGNVTFFWGKTSLLYDDPDKIWARSDDPAHRLLPKMRVVVDEVKKEVLIVSPYFVPGRAGVEFFRQLRQRGVRVLILTNSMSSTDAIAAYAAYSRYRTDLLRLGVELYEFKPSASYRPRPEKKADTEDEPALRASSQASLHAKTFTFDRKSIFIGSLNLDPRSANLNTEVGVVFESPELASQFSERLEAKLLELAWRVEAVPDKFLIFDTLRLNWVTQENGSTVRLVDEPGQTLWRNFLTGLIQSLPIESQL